MKTFIVLFMVAITAIGAVSFDDITCGEWNSYKVKYKKVYESITENNFRMKICRQNELNIINHNAKYSMGHVSFKLKLNKYADWFNRDLVKTLNGFNKTKSNQLGSYKKLRGAKFVMPANIDLPKQVDWRDLGAVTPVKDQGHCGSCWSFSTTGALEGQHFRQTDMLVSLSEQNLIDCSGKYGNNGCSGGLMDNAFKYIRDNRGLDTEKSYPYEAKDDNCRYNPQNSGADDVGFVDIPAGDEEKLKAAVATIGPVSVAIDASHQTFQFYSDGVYYEPACSSTTLDHGVLVVGYGTDEKTGEDYWLVKNSWGPDWGDQGYIKMARNKDNHCGIASSASYPLV